MAYKFNPLTGKLDYYENGGGGGSSTWGTITGTLSDQTDLQSALDDKLDVNSLNSNIYLFPTTTVSDIGGYTKLVTSIDDPDYDEPAVDIATGSISGTGQLIASLASAPGLIVGDPGTIQITTIGNIRKTSGATGSDAKFYFEMYHRNSGGTETLVATSNYTRIVSDFTYVQFFAAAILSNGAWTSTDRAVLKFYADKVGSGVAPQFEFQFGGDTPVRILVPVPVSVIPTSGNGNIDGGDSDTTYGGLTAIDGGLSNSF